MVCQAGFELLLGVCYVSNCVLYMTLQLLF